jgi:hypothetical protein
MIEEMSPFGTPAGTVAGSVYEDELPSVGPDTEERQSFGPTLEILTVSETVPVQREPEPIPAYCSMPPISSAALLHSAA